MQKLHGLTGNANLLRTVVNGARRVIAHSVDDTEFFIIMPRLTAEWTVSRYYRSLCHLVRLRRGQLVQRGGVWQMG